MYGRLAVLPDQAEPLQRARLLAALSVGNQLIQLRGIASRLGLAGELNAALRSFAEERAGVTVSRLHQIDRQLRLGRETIVTDNSPSESVGPVALEAWW